MIVEVFFPWEVIYFKLECINRLWKICFLIGFVLVLDEVYLYSLVFSMIQFRLIFFSLFDLTCSVFSRLESGEWNSL